ncbi:MAG: AMP-binding protein [Lachnospiraceae bacterium]|nr:AMP-binding protein [Lachnospiraceae bacterium]
MRYMECIMNRFITEPDKTSLIDAGTDRSLSYGELDVVTSKVYAYLSRRGIGKESFVMIDLPRGIDAMAVTIGVWRAGAAYVILEEGTSVEKKEYIYNDCKCSFIIGTKEYEEILSTPGKEGYVETSLHDACYAVYTSGTTGNPKGVIHEYGTLEDNIAHFKYNGKYLLSENGNFLLISPLSFVAGTIIINLFTYLGVAIVIAPFSVVKDKEKIKACMSKYKITASFLTPSYFRMNHTLNPEFKVLFLSGEPTENIYQDGIDIYNVYAQSETGYLASVFKIDKLYDIAPVGKSQCIEREVVILDDEGKKVVDGEIGELCFENPYFRGYMNLPKENNRAFRGGIYHSGDMGKMLPDGNVVILGRSDDMVKINGNRVELGAIEKAVKDILNLSWVAAKAFIERGKAYICVYYTEDIEFDHQEVKHKLSSKLPQYMIPSHFIRLKKVTMNANGKFSRKSLPRPNLTERTAPYVKPQNDIEKRLCEATEIILNVAKVGAMDDLYELGMDSINTIELLAETKLEGLTTGMVYRGLTPREIAKIYQKEVFAGNIDDLMEQEKRERSKEHLLTSEQRMAFDWQLNAPCSTMYNLFMFYKLGNNIDIPRLAKAIETVLNAHGVFSTTLSFNSDGYLVQKYNPDVNKKIEIEKIKEVELVDLREKLIRHYNLIGSPLYRVRIFKTENAGYLLFDMHHMISDGTSGKILFSEIANCYEGKSIRDDCYFTNLSMLEKETLTDTYAEAKEYYTKKDKEQNWSKYPKIDSEVTFRGLGSMTFLLPVYDDGFTKLMNNYSIGKNALMIALAVLTLAAYNNSEHISLIWTYNGRENKIEENIIGMLIRDITLYVDIEKGMTIEGFLNEIKKQILQGLTYSCYPHNNLVREPNMNLCVIYQGNFDREDIEEIPDITKQELPNPYDTNENLIDMEIYEEEEGTKIVITYLKDTYKESSIHRFRRMIMKSSALLAQYVTEPEMEISKIISSLFSEI